MLNKDASGHEMGTFVFATLSARKVTGDSSTWEFGGEVKQKRKVMA